MTKSDLSAEARLGGRRRKDRPAVAEGYGGQDDESIPKSE